jgi:hypothetical protein
VFSYTEREHGSSRITLILSRINCYPLFPWMGPVKKDSR